MQVLATSMIMIILATTPGLYAHAHTFDKPLQRLVDDNSLNWAGYYVSGSSFGSANATWTVPSISAGTGGDSSLWVGIGGVNGNNLIQTGTEQDCISGTTAEGPKFHGDVIADKPNGGHGSVKGGHVSSSCAPVYYAWWEIYPSNAEQKINSIQVSPGDTITASVQKNMDGTWTINLADGQQKFSTTQNFSPDETTAEAIVERPALCNTHHCKLTSLADFGNMEFSNAFAGTTNTGHYFDMLANTPLTMVDNSLRILAQPSTLSDPGTFTMTWFANR